MRILQAPQCTVKLQEGTESTVFFKFNRLPTSRNSVLQVCASKFQSKAHSRDEGPHNSAISLGPFPLVNLLLCWQSSLTFIFLFFKIQIGFRRHCQWLFCSPSSFPMHYHRSKKIFHLLQPSWNNSETWQDGFGVNCICCPQEWGVRGLL